MEYRFTGISVSSHVGRRMGRTLTAHAVRALVLLGLLTTTTTALADSEACAANFRAEGSAQQGTVYTAAQSIGYQDPHLSVGKLSDIYRRQGYTVSAARDEGTKVIVDVAPAADAAKHDATLQLVGDRQALSITMITTMTPGVARDAAFMRDSMCKALAYAAEPDNPYATPAKPAAAPAPASDTRTAADSRPAAPDNRTAPPSDAPKLNHLRPTAVFDMAIARTALEEGNATIRGTACVRHNVSGGGGLFLAANQDVALYPDSPYLQEWVKLMHKGKPGRDTVDTDPQFASTRLVGRTNNNGEFQFSRLKPGKYYLFTTMVTVANGARDVYLGSEQTDAQTITDYHTTQYFSVQNDDLLDKFVTVSDGQTVNATLSPHLNWKVLIGSNNGSPGIFGCRNL